MSRPTRLAATVAAATLLASACTSTPTPTPDRVGSPTPAVGAATTPPDLVGSPTPAVGATTTPSAGPTPTPDRVGSPTPAVGATTREERTVAEIAEELGLEGLIDLIDGDPDAAGSKGEDLLKELERVADKPDQRRIDRALERVEEWRADGDLDPEVAEAARIVLEQTEPTADNDDHKDDDDDD